MPSATGISLNEYLNTSYPDGDREYVSGEVVERNLGDREHSRLQRRLIQAFAAYEQQGLFAFPEQRVQVARDHCRVPDICVCQGEPEEQVFTTPPWLVIEILSKDDRAGDVQEKVEEYLAFGVAQVWVIDPRRQKAYVHTSEMSREAKDGVLRTHGPVVELPLAQLFL